MIATLFGGKNISCLIQSLVLWELRGVRVFAALVPLVLTVSVSRLFSGRNSRLEVGEDPYFMFRMLAKVASLPG